jgi:glycosyltransferase involved in cell wall biosynthesis
VHVCHIITSLEVGGAQTVMLGLIERILGQHDRATVISLTDFGPAGDRLRKIGVPVYALGISSLVPSPFKLARLPGLIGHIEPDIIQTWLYRADLFAALVRPAAPRRPIVWGIHGTNPLRLRLRTSVVVRINAALSRIVPHTIVYCSDHAFAQHAKVGYAPEKSRVIPNGVDTSIFRPDAEARASVRKELGLDAQAILIGLVARFSRVKGHETFFAAARSIHEQLPNIHFVLCGQGIEPTDERLGAMVRQAGVESVTHLLGTRADISRVTAALDIATSTSMSESFSLTMAEAMACAVPCVSTDCGGPRDLMNGLGFLVPVNDWTALSKTWMEILRLPPEVLRNRGVASREHIVRHYSFDRTAAGYRQLYNEICAPISNCPR